MTAPLLQVHNLEKHYRLPRQRLLAAPPVVRAVRSWWLPDGARTAPTA